MVSPRSRARVRHARGNGVIALRPFDDTLESARSLALDGALCVIAGYNEDVSPWVGRTGAVNLADPAGEPPRIEALHPDVVKALNSILLFGGRNGFIGAGEKEHSIRTLRGLLARGHQPAPEDLATYLRASGKTSERGVKNLAGTTRACLPAKGFGTTQGGPFDHVDRAARHRRRTRGGRTSSAAGPTEVRKRLCHTGTSSQSPSPGRRLLPHRPGVGDLLSTSRDLWSAAWFRYEFLVVSASWSLLAVEGALADRLAAGAEASLSQLVKPAVSTGLVPPESADRLDAGRLLRNRLLHAREQSTWAPGMAAPVLAIAHEIVADMYP